MELISRVLKVRLVKNMTKNGKIPRFSVLVATGNGEGGVGIGSASHVQAIDAISKASKIAAKTMSYFPLYQNRTIFHDDCLKFKASIVYVRPAPQGRSILNIRSWKAMSSSNRRNLPMSRNQRYKFKSGWVHKCPERFKGIY